MLTVTAWIFTLTFVETRQLLGVALVCPEARYASVRWMDDRIERRHLTGSMWAGVADDIHDGFDPGPVSKARAVARVLAGSRGAVVDVEYRRHRSVNIPTTGAVADALDLMLRKEDA